MASILNTSSFLYTGSKRLFYLIPSTYPFLSFVFFFFNFFPYLWNDILLLHIDNDLFQDRFGLDQRFIETAKKLKSQHKIGCLSW